MAEKNKNSLALVQSITYKFHQLCCHHAMLTIVPELWCVANQGLGGCVHFLFNISMPFPVLHEPHHCGRETSA